MNLQAVMEEIGDRLDTIEGLRVYRYPPKRITPPAAVLAAPETYTYDETYGRGMDRITLPVVLMVGDATDRAAWKNLSVYVDGAGPTSVKTIVETPPTGGYTELDTVRATGVEFDVWTMTGIDYIAAIVSLDIAGKGAP